jgi:prevent-host-death family protein
MSTLENTTTTDNTETRYVNTVDARKNFSDLVNSAAYGKQTTILLRRNKQVAAIVPIKELERLAGQPDSPVHISTVAIRANFSELINQVIYGQKHLVLMRHHKPIAGIISTKDLTDLVEEA